MVLVQNFYLICELQEGRSLWALDQNDLQMVFQKKPELHNGALIENNNMYNNYQIHVEL